MAVLGSPLVFQVPRGVPCCVGCWLGFSAGWAAAVCAVGGGPPARSAHASLRLGAVDLEASPGPATGAGLATTSARSAATGAMPAATAARTAAASAWPCSQVVPSIEARLVSVRLARPGSLAARSYLRQLCRRYLAPD